MCSRNGAVTYSEAENSASDKESGATMPKPPNLVGRAKSERCSVPGESYNYQSISAAQRVGLATQDYSPD